MRDIIYIHGFASSGNSYKGNFLRDNFGINAKTPSLPNHPENDIEILLNIIKSSNNPILVGSSLGGFYAEYFSKKYNLDAVLINPLTDVSLIKPFIGVHKYFETGEDFEFTFDDYEYLLNLSDNMDKDINTNKKRIILVAKDDEVINYNKSLNHFILENEKIYIFDNGGHTFNNKDEILGQINRMLNN